MHRDLPLWAWLLAVLPGALITLHGLAILPLSDERLTLSSFEPFEGHAYVVGLPPRSYPEAGEAAERVFENGRLVPYPQMAGWGPVVTVGNGRYRINADTLYLSTTDNSDPRSNGRIYSITRPRAVPRSLAKIAWLIAGLATLIVCVQRASAIWRFLAAPPFLAAAALLVALVLANRVWYFIDFPIPAIHPDSGGYFAVASKIGNGTWPDFGIRPPVYPLYLKAVFSMFDDAGAVVAGQTLLSVLASLGLVYGAYRWLPALGLPAAIAIALFMFGYTTFEHDTAVLSESVYTSFLMLAFAGLLVGLRSGRGRWLGAASTAMALAILTRPAGLFLEVIYLLVGAWLLSRRFPRRAMVAFLVPFPLLLLLMCTYNWRVVGVFATTTWGEANFAGATLLGWQTDPGYPPEINRSIEQIQDVIAKHYVAANHDPQLLDRSWNPVELSPIFLDGFNWEALTIAVKLGGRYETSARPWIRRVAFDAIRKRPILYTKFVYTMMYNYFKPTSDYDFRAYLQERAWQAYVSGYFKPGKADSFLVTLGKGFEGHGPPSSVVITDFDADSSTNLGDRILILPTRGWRVYELTHDLRLHVFDSWYRNLGVLAGLVGSVFVLVRSRFRHDAAFVVFILSVSVLGASLVVSLVEYSQPRYSYPMEWAHGLAIVLLPLLFMKAPTQPTIARPSL